MAIKTFVDLINWLGKPQVLGRERERERERANGDTAEGRAKKTKERKDG